MNKKEIELCENMIQEVEAGINFYSSLIERCEVEIEEAKERGDTLSVEKISVEIDGYKHALLCQGYHMDDLKKLLLK